MAASRSRGAIGFAVGPAIGGVVLGQAPDLLWPAAAAACLAAGAAALALERSIPAGARTNAETRPACAAETVVHEELKSR